MELWTQIVIAFCTALTFLGGLLSAVIASYFKHKARLERMEIGITAGLSNDDKIKLSLQDGVERFQRLEHGMNEQGQKIVHLEKNVINAQNLLIQNIIARLEKVEARAA